MKLLEDRAKSWLRGRGLPVPLGRTADSAEQASTVAAELGGQVAVKALVATGRRGKAGGVRLVSHPDAAHAAARELLGSDVAGRRCTRVYVEKAIAIQEELYLSFGFGTMAPEAVVSRRGGVDIEQAAAGHPAELVRFKIDPLPRSHRSAAHHGVTPDRLDRGDRHRIRGVVDARRANPGRICGLA